MSTRSIFLLISILFAGLANGHTQNMGYQKSLESIRESDLMHHLEILSSDEMEGRKTGEKGIDRAAQYLVDQFTKLGLKSPPNCDHPYVQEYKLQTTNHQKVLMVAQGDTLIQGLDFIDMGNTEPVSGCYPLVFAGFGIESEVYSDYNGMDPAGSVVVYLTGEPKDRNGKYLVSGNYLPTYTITSFDKDSIALSKGALATIRIDTDSARTTRIIRMLSRFSRGMQMQLIKDEAPSITYGTIVMQPQVAARLMGLTYDKLLKTEERLVKGKKVHVKSSTDIQLAIDGGERTVIAENIAGYIEGREHPDQFIVVTAHYDHLGVKGDDIYNGADDNASGTVAILEVAKAFTSALKEGYAPSRSILFLPVSGEEMGLLGSRYYVSHPLFPINQTRYNLNMDMIGRSDKKHNDAPPYVYVYLSDSSGSEMHHIAEASYEMMQTDLVPEFVFKSTDKLRTGGSDHMSFENDDVPVFYFFNGTHPDYHRPTDTVEKIHGHNLEQTTRLVFSLLWKLSND